ncbi:hypothetical protein [Fodinicola feengrottensis]|uniref:hypothetical protein n=1 Tax=Fodinicola feengrottensis TaxID=435914 RepID=UPI0024421536|nr:hypothetical protein [Fodinicola feengrottensis]
MTIFGTAPAAATLLGGRVVGHRDDGFSSAVDIVAGGPGAELAGQCLGAGRRHGAAGGGLRGGGHQRGADQAKGRRGDGGVAERGPCESHVSLLMGVETRRRTCFAKGADTFVRTKCRVGGSIN